MVTVGRFLLPARAGAQAGAEHFRLDEYLTEVTILPGSPFLGKTVAEVEDDDRYQLVVAGLVRDGRRQRASLAKEALREGDALLVLGLWRRDGWLEQELAQIRLRAGDVLVLQADNEALGRVANDPAFLMVVPFQGETRMRSRAPLATAIMVGTIGAASLGVPLEIAGLAKLLAGWLSSTLGDVSQFVVLIGLYLAVAVVTEFMSDAATTALLGPVAIALAQGLGHRPEPYVVTVAMAAVTAFLTPMAHHGNLVVYGPGGYRFADFAQVGAPLTAIIAVTVASLAPLIWR